CTGVVFRYNVTVSAALYTLALHDALPISGVAAGWLPWFAYAWPLGDRTIFTFYSIVFTPFVVLTLTYLLALGVERTPRRSGDRRSEEHTSELQSRENLVCRLLLEKKNNRI